MNIIATGLAAYLLWHYAGRVVRYLARGTPRRRCPLSQQAMVWSLGFVLFLIMECAIWL